MVKLGQGADEEQALLQHGATAAPAAVSSPGTTRRRQRLRDRPRQGPRLVGIMLALAACQQRLGASRRRGSSLQARRNRQRRRMLQRLAPPDLWPWWRGERFWWGLRWFGGGMAVTLLASRCSG